MKLYILGNGFDLWHGFLTSYKNFYMHSKDVLDEVGEFFGLPNCESAPWNDFENCLGGYNWKSMYDRHDFTDVESERFKLSEIYSLEDELNQQTEDLVRCIAGELKEWVGGVDLSGAKKLLDIDCDSFFINFNYTSTLQEVYGIGDARILHLHGRVGVSDLVYGHGVETAMVPELDPETGESNRTPFSDAEGAAMSPLYLFKKQVQMVLNHNRVFLDSLVDSGISEIIVIGHSLNDIDLPYFSEIAGLLPECDWIVYCHSSFDFTNHPEKLNRSGVPRERVVTRGYPV